MCSNELAADDGTSHVGLVPRNKVNNILIEI